MGSALKGGEVMSRYVVRIAESEGLREVAWSVDEDNRIPGDPETEAIGSAIASALLCWSWGSLKESQEVLAKALRHLGNLDGESEPEQCKLYEAADAWLDWRYKPKA